MIHTVNTYCVKPSHFERQNTNPTRNPFLTMSQYFVEIVTCIFIIIHTFFKLYLHSQFTRWLEMTKSYELFNTVYSGKMWQCNMLENYCAFTFKLTIQQICRRHLSTGYKLPDLYWPSWVSSFQRNRYLNSWKIPGGSIAQTLSR